MLQLVRQRQLTGTTKAREA